MKSNNWRPIILITYKKCIYFTNDEIQKGLVQKSDIFFCLLDQRQRIKVFEFILLYGQWDLASFTPEKKEKIIQKTRLTNIEIDENFLCEKNNSRYYNRAKLHK